MGETSSFWRKKRFPPNPLPEGSRFYPASSARRGRRARAFLYSAALLCSGAPSARRNRKPMRLSWGRAREGGFFLLKESSLSQKRKRLPFPKRLSWGWGLGKGSSFRRKKAPSPTPPSPRKPLLRRPPRGGRGGPGVWGTEGRGRTGKTDGENERETFLQFFLDKMQTGLLL